MAHRTQLQYVRLLAETLPEFFHNCRVLEIGSLDINGSIRSFFHNCDYVGLDVADGDGVDVVCEGQKYDAPDDSFDVVISCEAMEHNPYWVETFRNMIRLCRPGGLVVMTCATTGRPEHGTARTTPDASPLTVELGWNYYKNLTERDFRRAFDTAMAGFGAHRFWVNWSFYDLLFVGIKEAKLPSGSLPEPWELGTRAISAWIDRENAVKAHRYRAVMAKIFGEWWFVAMNRFLTSMNWLHWPH